MHHHHHNQHHELLPHERPWVIFSVLVGFFWLLDATMDAWFEGTPVWAEIIGPDTQEFSIRLLASCMLAVFAGMMQRARKQSRQLEEYLEQTRDQAVAEKQRVDAILAAMGDGVSILGRDFRILYQNAEHRRIVGGDIKHSYCYKAIHGREAVCPDCPVQLAFDDGQVHRELKQVQRPGRAPYFVEIAASPVFDEEGKVIAGIELVRDVTDREAAIQAQQHQADFLQQLMDTIPLAIFYKARDGHYQGCNTAFCELTGMRREQIVGATVFDLLPLPEASMAQQQDERLLQSPGTQSVEGAFTVNGMVRQVLMVKAVYRGADGGVEGIVGVISDISERKRAENEIRDLLAKLSQRAAELTTANQELESFSYSLSHDLRNPLTRISSASQELADSHLGGLDEAGRFFVRTIIEAAVQMEELIEAMLVLSRVVRSELVSDRVDLTALAEEVLLELRLLEPERSVASTIMPGLTVMGDRQLLKVALENLLGNAWKYTGLNPNAEIELGMVLVDGEERFFVRDNGVGFDMLQAEQLFQAFHRLHPASEFPGTGIGLATVQRIITRHGGRIWAKAVPAKGATFWFTLH